MCSTSHRAGDQVDRRQSIPPLPGMSVTIYHNSVPHCSIYTSAACALEGEPLATMRLISGRLILCMNIINIRGERKDTILRTVSLVCGLK